LKKAIEVIDSQVNRLANAVLRKNGIFALTADHGNAELMFDPKTRAISKEHTINPFPFIVAAFTWHQSKSQLVKIGADSQVTGILADVAPTLLSIMGLPVPEEMTGTPVFNL